MDCWPICACRWFACFTCCALVAHCLTMCLFVCLLACSKLLSYLLNIHVAMNMYVCTYNIYTYIYIYWYVFIYIHMHMYIYIYMVVDQNSFLQKQSFFTGGGLYFHETFRNSVIFRGTHVRTHFRQQCPLWRLSRYMSDYYRFISW